LEEQTVQNVSFKKLNLAFPNKCLSLDNLKLSEMSYKTGVNRYQVDILPICLEDSIADDNVVRVIDVFVEWLDLEKLGFIHATDNQLGTSMYPPGSLLKLYLYGYLNRIRSSRRLELECTRNIELHWLLQKLMPHYHTIADFRKDNPEALKGVFDEFTQFCIAMSLIEGKTLAFDGTKIRAQNNQKNNFNAARLKKLLARIGNKTHEYEQYLKSLDEQDEKEITTDTYLPHGKAKIDIEKTLAILAQRRLKYEGYQSQLLQLEAQGCDTEDLQISTVDPDARAMSFKQKHIQVGYNVQTVGDAKEKLILDFDVTNVGDTHALPDLALKARTILHLKEEETFSALADAGYHTGEDLMKCEQANVMTFVCPTDIGTPLIKTLVQIENDKFSKEYFIYDPPSDTYTCPNQQKLSSNGTWYVHKANSKRRKDRNYKQYTLPSKTCQDCPFSEQCQGKRSEQWHGKSIERTEYDDAVQANRKRLIENPKAYQLRKEIIEHPFGTIKRSWGFYYTLLRTKKKVNGEFALVYLAYNFRRVLTILGIKGLKEALNSTNLFIADVSDLLRAYFYKCRLVFQF
jgi:radical SAM protein with 4Fe4S-binding SPASM domain